MKFVCQICGYIYDEAKEGTAFADLPDSWVCPLCKAAKSAFKCIGCGACAEACPSGAISIVPTEYPPQQAKDERVMALANQLIKSKVQQEKIAERIANETELDGLYRLAPLLPNPAVWWQRISVGNPDICFLRAKILMTD